MVVNGLNIKRSGFTVAGAIATTAAAVGLASPLALSQEAVIQIDGSSTVYPITEAVAEEFMGQNRGTQVTVGISGTGGGFARFCNGETAISNASRPIKSSEVEACSANGVEYIELPIAYDALTIVVNPDNDWVDSLSFAELKTMWEPDAQGTITNWNQVRSSFPDAPLELYAPGTDSGTFDYFTETIVGESGASRGDFTASEDDNILVQGVAQSENALGYFGLAYYEENADRLMAVPIDGGNGPVAPSAETVENESYPLARPIFIYISAEAAERPEVQAFVEFYLNNATTLVPEVGYVPLSEEIYTIAAERFQSRQVGSVFEGENTTGVSVADLLRLEGGTQQ
ncbi:PstS family phosphate ABC transporter substrate-binding protein [Oculatella sp. LEGE 06141]|nr:PstS family phosphate ABC transporter substrate-binding protein [Oculatella sp. LEGE 06141]